jgi:hypothetical protein
MSRYRQTMAEAYKKVREQENKDHEVSMARGELEAIADKATQLASMLQGKSDEGNPLEAWVQSKITKAKDYINSVSDYMVYNPVNAKEEVQEGFSADLVKKAKEIAKKFADNMSKAVDEIEKIKKGLSKDKEVYSALRQYNEEVKLEEGKMKDIYTMQQDGKSSEEIAKLMKLPVKTIKDILGEEKEVPKGYHKMPDGTVMKDSEHKKDDKKEENDKEKEVASKDKEIESLRAQVALLKQKFENEKNKAIKPEPNPKTGEVPLTIGIAHAEFKKEKEKEQVKEETLDEFTSDMIKRLQKSYSTMPQKISPEQATALSKHLDRLDLVSLKQLVKANIPFMSTIARNKLYKKTGKFEERRLYIESIAGLQKKADQSGMPYSILKQVYDRGMAAWKSGHRPGASQQQWAFARVNSFVTKSSGTWGGADKDLAAKVKGSK